MLGRVTKQLVSIAFFLVSPEIIGRVVGVTLALHGGQPAIKGVSDGDLSQLLGLYKLTQLPQLLFDGIPTISDLLCLALSFFPGPCLRRDCLVLTSRSR